MISFSRLGRHGRLGNQLFQYAFLRCAARRLGTSFWCPSWAGDVVFTLDDAVERAPAPAGITAKYRASPREAGFDEQALRIEDGTDVLGFFESWRYLCDENAVRQWYRFRPERVAPVAKRYAHLPLERCVGLHVRLRDRSADAWYYTPRPAYYRRALERAGPHDCVLVFSDDPAGARRELSGLSEELILVQGNLPHEDLYLLSECGSLVCSSSTFCWWGAWLNEQAETVIVPAEGLFRPGAPVTCSSYWPEDWIKLRALQPVRDSYRVVKLTRRLRPDR
jgi:hypothetical protein